MKNPPAAMAPRPAAESGQEAAPITRRKALAFSLFSSVAMLGACGGNAGDSSTQSSQNLSTAPAPSPTPSPSPSAPPPAPSAWNVGPLYFVAGTNTSYDLAVTLPSDVARGGSFGVSSSGAALPAGMTLTAAGLLSLGSASVGEVVGVIFTYAAA